MGTLFLDPAPKLEYHISMADRKNPIHPVDEKAFQELVQILVDAENEEELKAFLKCLLTPSELYEITTRWALVRLIDEGMSQRKIAEKLGLSLCKITRGSKELKKPKSGFRIFLDRFKGLNQESPQETTEE